MWMATLLCFSRQAIMRTSFYPTLAEARMGHPIHHTTCENALEASTQDITLSVKML
jgi:hypothetical protein